MQAGAMGSDGFDMLLPGERVHELMQRPDVRLLHAWFAAPGSDVTGQQDFERGHLPGAQLFDIEAMSDRASPLPNMLPSAQAFSASVEALGISNDTWVIVYNQAGLSSAPRVWWMFKAFGHDRVSILDGGMQHWKQQGRPVSTRPADAVPPGHFVASPQPNRVRSKAEVARNLLSHEALVVDARGAPRYSGEEKETLPGWATGHIPASVNLPFMTLSDAATGLMLPPDLLGKRAESVGVSLSRPVIATCRTGISACVVAFTLERLGHGSVSVYDGSWAEWGTDPASPVETGKGSNQ